MYIGDEAEAIVKDENDYNDSPTPNQQWILMKYYLKNNGNDMLEASDILNSDYFYTKGGASMPILDTATFSGDRSGQGIYDIDLYSGAEAYCWLGILVQKSYGLPYLQISNGYDKKAKYSLLNTDPNYRYVSGDIKGHWAKDSILYAMGNGWVQTTDKFRPDDDITRAEFVKIVNKAFNYTNMVSEPYTDVKSSDWFYDEVRKGLAVGYLTPSDKFRPYDNITRQEASKIIGSIMNLKGDGKMEFKDANKIDSWAWYYVDGLNESGIIKGNNGYFAPHNNLTRAEGVTILQRAKN